MPKSKYTRPTRQRHYGKTKPKITFERAYRSIETSPNRIFKTIRGVPFRATAQKALKGQHPGKKVIVFRNLAGKEKSRAYECCWGAMVNCNRTYINSYQHAIRY